MRIAIRVMEYVEVDRLTWALKEGVSPTFIVAVIEEVYREYILGVIDKRHRKEFVSGLLLPNLNVSRAIHALSALGWGCPDLPPRYVVHLLSGVFLPEQLYRHLYELPLQPGGFYTVLPASPEPTGVLVITYQGALP